MLTVLAFSCAETSVQPLSEKEILKKSVQNWINTNEYLGLNQLQAQGISFNLNDMVIHEKIGDIRSITINQNSYKPSNTENYCIGFYEVNGKIVNSIIVKITNFENQQVIEHFNKFGELFTKVKYDPTTKTFNKLELKDEMSARTTAGCGQKTMDCVDRIYTKVAGVLF